MKRILELFSMTVIVLFFLSIYGWAVNQVANNNKKFGILNKPIEFLYTFPDLFKKSVKEVRALPRTFIKTYEHFQPINSLEKDLLVFTSYSDSSNGRIMALINLRNDSIHRMWSVENPFDEVARIVHPLYLSDGSGVYNYYYKATPGLTRLDPSGAIVWQNDSMVVHHGMNLNADGDLWACTKSRAKASGRFSIDDKEIYFNDYRITKYDIGSGEIMFDKSITEILVENGLANYLFKTSNVKDPVHLNDVQPALTGSKYFEEEDLFISMRGNSMILQYRPSTNELIHYWEGPFISQHDVDVVNDSTLVLFNNNTFENIRRQGIEPIMPSDMKTAVDAGDHFSCLVAYHFDTDEWSFVGDTTFRANKIFTKNEGLFEYLDEETYFVEEQNSGLLWVIRNDSVIYKNVLKSQNEGYHHLPNWTRIVSYE